MSDDYFSHTLEAWWPVFRDARKNDDDLKRAISLFAKEVSRDTRHAAFDIAQGAARDIVNMSMKP